MINTFLSQLPRLTRYHFLKLVYLLMISIDRVNQEVNIALQHILDILFQPILIMLEYLVVLDVVQGDQVVVE